MKPFPLVLLASTLAASAATDVVFLEDGSRRSGSVIPGQQNGHLILEVTIPPPANRPDLPPAKSRVTIPLSKIQQIEFASDPALERALASGDETILRGLWERWRGWMRMPRSPAPRVALALAEARLRAKNPGAALELFREIEASAWDESSRFAAKPGRLRAMIAMGQADEAAREAEELAKISEDPAVLIEANHIRAQTAEALLRKLLEENPRWQEDLFIIPERDRLHHLALDLYLHPALFHGQLEEPAARGLWGAIGIYQLSGELEAARELARDIAALYPARPEAQKAKDFLASLPKELLEADPEREAREQMSEASPSQAPPAESPKSKTPKHEKT